jgi:hypothetical protein
MNFQQAEQAYQNLVNQFNSGSLSAEQFQAGLASLRVQDTEGSWWQ